MTDQADRLFVLGSFVNACCAGVERLPQAGESLRATSFTAEPGGKGFNVAVGARRLGAAVDCLAAVGQDLLGNLAEPAFVAAGLSPALLRRYEAATGAGIGFIEANGENCLAVFPGANLRLSAQDVRAVSTDVAAAAMVIAQFEIADPPIIEAFRIARRHRRQTLLNPSPFRLPPPDMIELTTILVLNEREATALADALDLTFDAVDAAAAGRLAHRLHARGLELLVVTLGERGAVACPRDQPPIWQPAYHVEAVDTLGAGDAFIAALAVSLVQAQPLCHAIQRAAAAGAIMASRHGTYAALPTDVDVDRFLQGSQLRITEAQ